MKEKSMIKQKIQILLLTVLSFGTSCSFLKCFWNNDASVWAVIILGASAVFVLFSPIYPKIRKKVLDFSVKTHPLAAVVFTASFVLSFLKYSMVWAQLFSVFVLSLTSLCMAFEKLQTVNKKSFYWLVLLGALGGGCVLLADRISFVYTGLIVLSLLCRPFVSKKTIQDVWKDVAFPLFVLIFSFIVFVSANHNTDFPSVIAESVVMLMIGGLLMASSSALNLTLMSVVMMVFGSYVFSVQNADSVFNRKAKETVSVQQERISERER